MPFNSSARIRAHYAHVSPSCMLPVSLRLALPLQEYCHPHHSPHPSTFANDKKLQEAAYIPADRLPPVQPPQLTVFLVSQLQNHVLLSQFMVGLLQVFNVIDGFAQDTRLVHLQGIQTSRTQFIL